MAKLFLRVYLLAGTFRVIKSGLHITWGFVSARLTQLNSNFSSLLGFGCQPDRTLLSISGCLYLRFFTGLQFMPTDYVRRAEHKALVVVRHAMATVFNFEVIPSIGIFD